uniref:asparagine synthase-related protein n=1 Tax=Ningiella ruwaisensis TaxID=2364274 RepID=UPI00109FBB3E|nr:asparagine synthase-related protein [Ningiella ruwaisensis]
MDTIKTFESVNSSTLSEADYASFLVNGQLAEGHQLPNEFIKYKLEDFSPRIEASNSSDILIDKLWSTLEETVTQAYEGRNIILPLSGGYDSACLLGLLLKRKSGQIFCFSFDSRETRPGSDADIAKKQAEKMEVEHRTFFFEDHSLLDIIRANAAAGPCLRDVSYEIHAYKKAFEYAEKKFENPIALFGDEAMGWVSMKLQSNNDVLGSIGLRSSKALSKLNVLSDAHKHTLIHALDRSYESIIESSEHISNNDCKKDFLYQKVRLPYNLLPLRKQITGPIIPYAMPLLDKQALNVIEECGVEERLDKSLYVKMLNRKLPAIFSIPRTNQSQATLNVRQKLIDEASSIKTFILEQKLCVPNLLSNEQLVSWLSQLLSDNDEELKKGSKSALKPIFRSKIVEILNGRFVPRILTTKLRQRLYNPFNSGPDEYTMFLRALVMAITWDRQIE